MNISSGHVCDRGLNPKRPVNQDRFLVDPARCVYAVFDGVGGQRAGEIASQTAAETVEEALSLHLPRADAGQSSVQQYGHSAAESNNGGPGNTTTERIRSAIAFANRDIYELAGTNPEYDTMATTVALVQIEGDIATIGHVGDSRVYRLERDKLYRETIDHTDFDDRVRAGLVRPGTGVTNDSHMINRALGAAIDVDVEIKTIRFSLGARFLICTDGIYRMLQDAEIGAILAKYDDPQRTADELKRVVHERGAGDNLTAIVVHTGATERSGKGGSPLEQGKQPATDNSPWTAGVPGRGEQTRELGPGGAPFKSGDRISVPIEPVASSINGPRNSREINEIADASRPAMSMPPLWILLLAELVLLAGVSYATLKVAEWRQERSAREAAQAIKENVIVTARDALEHGDVAAAEATLSKTVADQPANVQANYWLGRTQLVEGKFPEAIKHFEAATNLDSTLLDAYLQAAGAYQAMGEKVKASEMLAKYAEARRKAQPTK